MGAWARDGGLGPPQPAHPGQLSHQGPVQLLDLGRGAAVGRVGLPQLHRLRGDRQHAQVETVMPAHPLHGFQGLGEVVPGVDEDHFDGWLDPDGQIDENGVRH